MHVFLATLGSLVAVAVAQAIEYSDASVEIIDAFATEGVASMSFAAVLKHDAGLNAGLFDTPEQGPLISWETVDGTAFANQDYIASRGEFRFANDNDNARATFSVPLLNDNVQELRETFGIELQVEIDADTPLGATALRLESGVGIISDQEDVTVLLHTATQTEVLGGDPFEFTVELSHEVNATVSFSFSTLDGTATAGEDYTAVTEQTISFVPLQGRTQTFEVEMLNDNLQENVETFEVQLQFASNPVQLSFVPATGRARGIFGPEFEGVTLLVEDVDQEEGEAFTMDFTLKLSHEVDERISVLVETVDGLSSDVLIPAPEGPGQVYRQTQRSIFFEAKETEKLFSVPIENDNVQSAHAFNEDRLDGFGRVNFGVEYTIAAGFWSGSVGGADNPFDISIDGTTSQTGRATGSVFDFEGVEMSLRPAGGNPVSAVEGSIASLDFEVSLTHRVVAGITTGTPARGASFTLQSAASTNATVGRNLGTQCEEGSDLCFPLGLENQLVVFDPNVNPGFQSQVLSFAFPMAADDQVIEGDESFGLELALGPSSLLYRIALAESVVDSSILDNDIPVFSISPSGTTELPESASAFRYTVALNLETERQITYNFATRNVVPGAGPLDFAAGQGTLVFPAGTPASTENIVKIPIINDNIQESTESFLLDFLNPLPRTIVPETPPTTLTSAILDDEGLTVSISSMLTAQDESAQDWLFTVTLSHALDAEIDVDVDTIDAQSYELIFEAGETEKVINVVVQNDDIQEGTTSDESTFAVLITNIHSDAIPATILLAARVNPLSVLTGIGRVSDDEGLTISVQNGVAYEGIDPLMEFEVTMSHMVTESVTVTFSTADGTAVSGGFLAQGLDDFSSVFAGSVTFPAFTQTASINIEVNNDQIQESSTQFDTAEQFTLSLGSVVAPQSSGFEFGRQDATGTIIDIETVEVCVGSAIVAEAAGATMDFVVSMTHVVDRNVTIEYDLIASSAIFGTDYTSDSGLTRGSLTLASGVRTGVISVGIMNDNTQEPTETFSLRLQSRASPLDASISVCSTLATGTITDNEGITLEINDVGPQEKSNSPMTFDVLISHSVSQDFVVSYETVEGTAMAFSNGVGDFRAATGTVTFGPSHDITTPLQVSIDLVEDQCQTPPGDTTFFVELSAPRISTSLATMGVRGTGTLLWTDQSPTLSISNSSANEGEEMIFTVALSNCITQPIEISFTADASSLYTPLPIPTPPIVFPPSAVPQEQEFSISLANDNIQGSGGSFEVRLSPGIRNTPSSLGVTFANQRATGVVFDDEGVTIDIDACQTIGAADFAGADSTDLEFLISLSHVVTERVTVAFSTADGTGTSSGPTPDYVGNSGVATFDAFSVASFPVPVTVFSKEDTVGARNFTVTLDNLNVDSDLPVNFGQQTGKGAIAGVGSSIITLEGARRKTCSEAEGVCVFSVVLADIVTEDLEVRVNVATHFSNPPDTNSEALEFNDFVYNRQNVVFQANAGVSQEQTFEVEIVDDFLQELTELFDIELVVVTENFRDQILFVVSNEGHQILDNDFATISIVDASVGESEGASLVFDVVLSHFVYTNVQVTFETIAGGLASDSEDYSPVALAIIFPACPLCNGTSTAGHILQVGVPIINDNIQEASETLMVQITNVVTEASLGDGTFSAADINPATGTIEDIEGTTLVMASLQQEEGTAFTFDVSLSHDLDQSVSVVVEVAGFGDSPAVANQNFIPLTQTLTFSSNVLSHAVVVDTVDNIILQPDVAFRIEATSQTPDMNIQQPPAPAGVGTIIDDNEGVVIEVTQDEFFEPNTESADNQLAFTLRLSHDVIPGFVLTYDTVEGSAHSDNELCPDTNDCQDFVSTSGTINWVGQKDETHVITIEILNDNLVENVETFSVTADLDNNLPISIDTMTAEITDFEGATFSIRESRADERTNSEMLFTVTLSHGVEGEFSLVYDTVAFDDSTCSTIECNAWESGRMTTSGVSVEDGQDYVPVQGALSEKAVSSDAEQTFLIRVDIVDDFIIEVDEVFGVRVTGVNPAGFNLDMDSSNAEQNGRIGDNEDATLAIFDRTTVETAGTVSLDVRLSHRAQPTMTVFYVTFDGTATSSLNLGENPFNVDFEAVPSGRLEFPGAFSEAGFATMDSQRASITVTLRDDNVLEEEEQFCVTLLDNFSPNVGLFIPEDMKDGWVQIVEDAEFATISIADASTNAEAGSLIFPVSLSHAVQSAEISVEWSTEDGSAVSGEDFVAVSAGVITFPRLVTDGPHSPQDGLAVSIVPDEIAEDIETFNVRLDAIQPITSTDPIVSPISTTNPEQISIQSNRAIGTIRPSTEDATISISSVSQSEADTNFVFTVSLSHRLARDLVINWQTLQDNPVSATIPLDYDFQQGVLTFEAGDNDSKEITVVVNNDDVVQASHSFVVQLTLPSDSLAECVENCRAVGTILDDDVAILSIADAEVAESAAVDEMRFTVTSDHQVAGTVEFEWRTIGRTASEGVDFTPVEDVAVLPAFTQSVTVTVPIANDNIQESDETFEVTGGEISTSSGNVQWGDDQAFGLITDAEGAIISMVDVTVNENVGAFAFQVFCSHRTSDEFTVEYTVTSTTASLTVPTFGPAETFVTLPACDTCVPGPIGELIVTVDDDATVEPNQIIEVELSSPPGKFQILNPVATITIIDNDVGTITFNNNEGSEADGVARVSFTLSNDFLIPQEFEISTFNIESTAGINAATGVPDGTEGGDFTLGVLNFQEQFAGDYEFNIQIKNDDIQETDEFFGVSVCAIGRTDECTIGRVGIVDDNEGFTFTVSTVEEFENVSPFVFTVVISHEVEYTTQVSYTVVSEIERVPAQQNTFSIPAGSAAGSSVTFGVEVVNDNVPQQDEEFSVVLENQFLNTPVQATGIILDNDGGLPGQLPPIGFAFACDAGFEPESSNLARVDLLAGVDFVKHLRIGSCFVDANNDELTFTYSTIDEAGLDISITGEIMTIVTNGDVEGDFSRSITVTAADRSDSDTLQIRIEVRASTPLVSLADFTEDGQLNLGEYFQARVTNIVDIVTSTCSADEGTQTDCCNAQDQVLDVDLCERVVPATAGRRLLQVVEAVDVSVHATASGRTFFCMGNSIIDEDFCSDVDVHVPPTIGVPTSMLFTVAGSSIEFDIEIEGGDSGYTIRTITQGAASGVDVSRRNDEIEFNMAEGDGVVHIFVEDDSGAKSYALVTARGFGSCA